MGVFPDIFTEMAALLLLAAGVGALAVRLRQPLIVAFIAVGILVGPSVLGWVSANDRVDLLAKLGISLLLFVVGLKLDLNIIRTMGPVALATGLGQVIFTSIIGYVIALALGMTPIAALYVAVALTFSSTIIIVKLLSDKREVDTLHGRIALGFLIVQDLVVVLAMIGLNALSETSGAPATQVAITVAAKGGAFLVVIGLTTRYILPRLLHLLSRSQELLGVVWHCLGRGTGNPGCQFGLQQGGRCIRGRGVAGFHAVSGRTGSAVGKPARFLAAVFFHRLGGSPGPRTVGCPTRPVFSVLLIRADRQSVDRHGHHGGVGVPQAYRILGRAHGGTNQRIFIDSRRPGTKPWTY